MKVLIFIRLGCLLALAIAILPSLAADPDPAMVAEITRLNQETVQLRNQGKYDQALASAQHALAYSEKNLGSGNIKTVESLNNLAVEYWLKNDHAQAESLLTRAVAIREKTLGKEHPDTAESLNTLAELYKDKRDYAQAIPLLVRALAIWEKALGKTYPGIARHLNNLARLYEKNSDYARAIPLYTRVLAIKEKTLGRDHLDTATTLGNLARLYQANGEYGQAEPLLSRALAIREKGLPDTDTATSLNNLAMLHDAKGDFTQAETLLTRALAIDVTTRGKDHPDTTITLSNLALLYQAKGDYAKAEPLYARALAIQEKALGKEHPGTATSLQNFGLFFWEQDDLTKAKELLMRTTVIQEKQLTANIGTGSELQKQAFSETLVISTYVNLAFHLNAAPADLDAVQLAFTTILQRKARVFSTLAGQWSVLHDNLSPANQILMDELQAVRSQLATQTYRGLGTLDPAQYQRNLADLTAQVEQLEAKLSAASAEFKSQVQDITLDGVQKALPKDSALLELMVYRPYNTKAKSGKEWGEERYAAYVLHPTGSPQGIDLGEAKPLDALILAYRQRLQHTRQAFTRAEALAIAPLLKVKPILDNAATEATVKQAIKPAILHIATHGFFEEDQPLIDKATLERSQRSFGLLGDQPHIVKPIANPLLRSGLILAGVEQHQSGNNEDGRLTAMETSGLNLWGTQLVVLSACDTGVGSIKNGEGVYGLRRALVNAGVRTQVMSLWKVNDEATKDLMVDFYRRLAQGEGRAEAMRQAKLDMLKDPDRNHPYYWASFILSGDGSPMPGGIMQAN